MVNVETLPCKGKESMNLGLFHEHMLHFLGFGMIEWCFGKFCYQPAAPARTKSWVASTWLFLEGLYQSTVGNYHINALISYGLV